MASNSSPHLQGFLVTSKVHRSRTFDPTRYCVAETSTPGVCPCYSRSTFVSLCIHDTQSLTLTPHLTTVDVGTIDECSEMCRCLRVILSKRNALQPTYLRIAYYQSQRMDHISAFPARPEEI